MKGNRAGAAAVLLALVLLPAGAQNAPQGRARLAILPFTGGSQEDAESIAEFFSYEPELNRVFVPVPRTRHVENVLKEQQFQRSGLTDSDTIAALGRQLNADYVLAGHISRLGSSKLLLITIINVEKLRQIAGDYREYRQIEETSRFLPGMARRIAQAAARDASRSALPGLAVLPFNTLSSGVNEADAEVLAQILATELANSGRYAVYPRTAAIEQVMAEHHIERSGMTDPESIRVIGKAVNAEYVLSANVRKLGEDNYFSAAILHVEEGSQGAGNRQQYRNLSEGLTLMPALARNLLGTAAGAQTDVFVPENFVRISGGTFTMGSPPSETARGGDESPHPVTAGAFLIGKYEVTQREWEEVTGSNPSAFKGPNLPVENVSWYDAIEYCNLRSERENLTPVYTVNRGQWDGNNSNRSDPLHWTVTWNRQADGYRLPTEAEWEYACRAGTLAPFSTGNSITTNLANYDGAVPYGGGQKGQSRQRTWEAGSGAANAWGLFDMHGNVWEWCWDWYAASYPSGAQTDPAGTAFGSFRVLRGGSWNDGAPLARSAYRHSATASSRNNTFGFRLARNAQ